MKDKIKVLFFMDGIGNAGGIQEMSIKWMENIEKDKFQIDILSYNTGKRDNFPERIRALGGEVYVIPKYTNGDVINSIKHTKKFFKEHHYDILHAHSSSKAVFIMHYAKKAGVKVRILHSHSSKFVVTDKKSLLIANMLLKPTLKNTTDFFACSPEAGIFLFSKEAYDQGKITLIHNGINTKKFLPDAGKRKKMRNELGMEERFVIGNVGRFRPQKNHLYLMDIFKSVCDIDSDATLLCVGNGELEESIKEKATQLGIFNRIKFLGFRSDVSDLMQSFDLLLMPSLFEGLPVTAVEAQAEGVPGLFANTITPNVAILPTSSFLSLEDAPEVWAKKIISYKNIEREENPYKYILEQGYDIEIETKKLEKYYLDSLNG